MSAINEIASLWMDGTMRTLDAFRTGFGATMSDPPPATRSRVIYESGLVRLRHYEARGENKKRVPLLLIYSLIKRPFILDLQPGRSVVEYLVKQGFDVYLIDWIPPRAGDKDHGFDEYVNTDIANAVRAIQIYTGIEQISILGYCFGALLGLMYSALHSGNVKNLVTLTIPLDTSPRKLPIEHLTAAMTSRSAQMIVDMYGNAPAWMMYSFFNTLAPTHHLLDKFVGAYRTNSKRPGYLDTFTLFERWLHSDVPMAGRLFLETSEMWRENSLLKGTMKIGESIADLARVTMPLLNVIGDHDDIVNPMSSEPLPELVSSEDKQNLHYPTGHMGAAISADSLKRLWPQITNWLSARDE
jgi:polyhydroxyalkanoate synthase subunit PhaC